MSRPATICGGKGVPRSGVTMMRNFIATSSVGLGCAGPILLPAAAEINAYFGSEKPTRCPSTRPDGRSMNVADALFDSRDSKMRL